MGTMQVFDSIWTDKAKYVKRYFCSFFRRGKIQLSILWIYFRFLYITKHLQYPILFVVYSQPFHFFTFFGKSIVDNVSEYSLFDGIFSIFTIKREHWKKEQSQIEQNRKTNKTKTIRKCIYPYTVIIFLFVC